MKVFRLLCICLFGLLSVPGGGWGATGPSLSISPQQADLGTIRQGRHAEQIFLLTNVGDQQLEIGQIKTSCGCTAVVPQKKTLAPGESTDMVADFNSTGFKGDIRKSITIHSNDANRPRQEVFLTGHVRPEVEIQPSLLDMGRLPTGVPTTVPLKIINHGESPITIRNLEILAKDVSVPKPETAIPAGGSLLLQVTFLPVRENSSLNGYLVITTSRTDLPPLRIPVFATAGQQP